MHSGGSRWLHYNMFLMAQSVRPDFTIIDGVRVWKETVRSNGTPVDHRIAMPDLTLWQSTACVQDLWAFL